MASTGRSTRWRPSTTWPTGTRRPCSSSSSSTPLRPTPGAGRRRGSALTRLMGLWGQGGRPGRATIACPTSPRDRPPLDRTPAIARRRRPPRRTMAAIRQEIQTLAWRSGFAVSSRWTGMIDVGADVARHQRPRRRGTARWSIEASLADQRRAAIGMSRRSSAPASAFSRRARSRPVGVRTGLGPRPLRAGRSSNTAGSHPLARAPGGALPEGY